MASFAAAFSITERIRVSDTHSDFAPVWYGARALLTRVDPYATFGPGLAFHYEGNLFYPVSAMIAAIPLGLLPEDVASVVFITMSAALVAYAVSKKNWDLVWIFPSSAFIVAVRACQWAPIMGAAMLVPSLAWIYSFKPNIGTALALSTGSRKSLKVAIVGTALLCGIGFILLPSWPLAWLQEVHVGTQTELTAPIARPFGFVILLALLRWRQAEARYLLVFACIPQTASWYELFTLLLIARTKREAQFLSLTSSAGYMAQIALLQEGSFLLTRTVGVLMILFGYIPALAVVLKRRNEGPLPAWYSSIRELFRYSREPARIDRA